MRDCRGNSSERDAAREEWSISGTPKSPTACKAGTPIKRRDRKWRRGQVVRNANKTETKTKKYSIRIFTVRNSSPEGESDVYKAFIAFNDDGNIDFIIWENVNLND